MSPTVHSPPLPPLVGGCDAGVVMESETLTTSTENTATLSELTRATSLTSVTDLRSQTKTTVRPDWRVTGFAGVKLGPNLLQPPVLAGAGVERRLLGGFSAGLMGGVEVDPVSQKATGGFILGQRRREPGEAVRYDSPCRTEWLYRAPLTSDLERRIVGAPRASGPTPGALQAVGVSIDF